MSNITINVDFLAGTDFVDAATEARQLARRMDVAYVCYSLNGTSVSVGQNADIDYINDQYLENKTHIVSA